MINFVTNILTSTQDHIFWVSASLGTTFFLARVLLSFLGGGFFEHDADFKDLHNGLHLDGSLVKIFKTHSLSGFLMIFGWAGLACSRQFNMTAHHSIVIALTCGFAMLIVTALIMHAALSLEERGSVFSIKKTLGATGTVSQRIPSHGQGKIQLTINNVTREILAQSHNKKPIQSFTVVKVTKVIDHEIVEVIELEENQS